MSLDIFQNDQAEAIRNASQRIAPDLPATFGDTFDNALTTGIEWHNSVAYQFAKEHALRDYIQNVRDTTGETLPNPGYLIGGTSLDEFNAKQQELNEKYPVNLSPMTDDGIEKMTQRRMARVHAASVAMNERERTWGGTAGNVLGGMTASASEPIILATLPLVGMHELGIVGRALEFGAINAATETAIAVASYRSHEAAAPGSTKHMASEIASAGAFGLVLGGAFGTLGRLLKAGSKPLPTSVRDEVNVGASNAQIETSNVFRATAEGEMAGRDALTQSVTQAAKGEPITAGDGFAQAHVDAFAASVDRPQPGYVRFYHGGREPTDGGPRWLTPHYEYARDFRSLGEPNEVHFVDIPQADLETNPALRGGFDDVNGRPRNFEAPESFARQLKPLPVKTAAEITEAAERSQRPITFGEKPDVERFEPIPGEAEDAATYWERRLEAASPEERAALGATDQVPRPVTAPTETLTGAPLKPSAEPIARTAADRAPKEAAALGNDAATYEAVQRNLDRIRLENPDAEYSIQVRQQDGTYQLVTRKLEDVLDEIEGMETAGRELMACATGMQAAE